MDTLIQASKDNDNSKIRALSTEETWLDEEDDRWVVDEEETDSEVNYDIWLFGYFVMY